MAVDAQAAALAPGERAAAVAVAREFGRDDHAALAHLGDVRRVRASSSRARRAEVRGERAVALDHVVGLEDVERRQRRRAGQRIAGVAVRVQERAQLRVLVVERGVDASPVSTTDSGR